MENFKNIFNNVFSYSAGSQAMFTEAMSNMGYTTSSTFFADLSVAEWFSIDAIRETYNQVLKEWSHNIRMFTEFVMCLNHKSWFWHETRQFSFDKCDNKELSELYCELYDAADLYVAEHFSEEEKDYYYATTD